MKLFDRIAQRVSAWVGRVLPARSIHVTNNVTINVQGNEDPSRLARLVHEKFAERTKPPTEPTQ